MTCRLILNRHQSILWARAKPERGFIEHLNPRRDWERSEERRWELRSRKELAGTWTDTPHSTPDCKRCYTPFLSLWGTYFLNFNLWEIERKVYWIYFFFSKYLSKNCIIIKFYTDRYIWYHQFASMGLLWDSGIIHPTRPGIMLTIHHCNVHHNIMEWSSVIWLHLSCPCNNASWRLICCYGLTL